jgi:very-short-patch-repair endonuclease
VRRGRLHRVHRGVYAVGHSLLTTEGRYMAAVLVCGPDAVLSHRTAADLWWIRRTDRAGIEVTTPSQAGRKRRGIEAHGATPPPEEVTVVQGIPCTTVARTLLDLADVLDRRGVERAIERAEQLRLFDLTAVEEALSRANGRKAAATLVSILASPPYATPTGNDREEAFLQLTRSANLPDPEVNAWIPFPDGGGAEADFLWRDRRLVIETDGNETHGTRQAFESDRLRDQRLALIGYQVIRFTWRQVFEQPELVAATVARLARLRSA